MCVCVMCECVCVEGQCPHCDKGIGAIVYATETSPIHATHSPATCEKHISDMEAIGPDHV